MTLIVIRIISMAFDIISIAFDVTEMTFNVVEMMWMTSNIGKIIRITLHQSELSVWHMIITTEFDVCRLTLHVVRIIRMPFDINNIIRMSLNFIRIVSVILDIISTGLCHDFDIIKIIRIVLPVFSFRFNSDFFSNFFFIKFIKILIY